MENLVPLGTGNSRLMKSNIPSNTTLAQLIQMWNNGTFPYDIGPLNSAGISQQGTPLNKDTLLKDATAALYGLTNTAVPDDVLAKLAEAAFVEDGVVTDIDGNIVVPQIATGSYVGTGTYGTSNPNTLTFDFAPEMVVIYSMADANKRLLNIGGTGVHAIPTANLTTSYQAGRGFYYDTTPSYGYTRKAEDGKTIQWYATGPAIQFNTTSYTYYYTAIG